MTSERQDWLARPANESLSSRLKIMAWIVSVAVLILVGMMRRPEFHISLPTGWSLSFLPLLHATLNSAVALCLMLALVCVKQGRIGLHRSAMTTALILSVVFLTCYVAYHFTTPETLFGDVDHDGLLGDAERATVGGRRTVYLALLLSHILLAAVSLPFILLTFIAGWTNRFGAHRKLVKWVFPIWLYVSVTGPICYLMLRPYY